MSDFNDILILEVPFEETELDEGVDFEDAGDLGRVVVTTGGFGEDGFGDNPFGSSQSIVLGFVRTPWTEVETP